MIFRWNSPLGTVHYATLSGALVALDFHEARARSAAAAASDPSPDVAVEAALARYFDGALDAFDALAVAARGTAFQTRVWRALRTIEAGRTTTYGALAAAIDAPGAARAVGAANGQNPVALVVPCHRVVGANGLVGYAGGLARKAWLLEHEARWAHARAPRRDDDARSLPHD
jgi:methylated-DNA-[protein]-cysteine S-methyltransferase